MTDAQTDAGVKDENEPMPVIEKPQKAASRSARAAKPELSVAAVKSGERAAQGVLDGALRQGGFTRLADVQRYLGGADTKHALTWLALRTQSFTVTS